MEGPELLVRGLAWCSSFYIKRPFGGRHEVNEQQVKKFAAAMARWDIHLFQKLSVLLIKGKLLFFNRSPTHHNTNIDGVK